MANAGYGKPGLSRSRMCGGVGNSFESCRSRGCAGGAQEMKASISPQAEDAGGVENSFGGAQEMKARNSFESCRSRGCAGGAQEMKASISPQAEDAGGVENSFGGAQEMKARNSFESCRRNPPHQDALSVYEFVVSIVSNYSSNHNPPQDALSVDEFAVSIVSNGLMTFSMSNTLLVRLASSFPRLYYISEGYQLDKKAEGPMKEPKNHKKLSCTMADSTRDVERQVFILDEAEEELDWGDEDEDALSAPDVLVREEQERARQKAESVKLKDRSERSLLENVVSRWEQRLNETAADETQNPINPRRKHHSPCSLTPSPSPSRASLPPEPPAPVLHLGNAGTSHPALQSLPVPPSSLHPSPAAPEARSTSLALPAYPPSTESPGDIALAAPKAKAPAPTPSAHTQSSEGSGEVSLAASEVKSSLSLLRYLIPSLHAPSPEGSRDVFLPAPQVKLTSPAPRAQSP
ncbi:hypothetical protein DFJ43DRAFT_1044605, partial [Lentinula guzmanii]